MLKLSLTFSGYHPYGLVHQPLVAHLNGAVVPAEPIEVQGVPLSLPKMAAVLVISVIVDRARNVRQIVC